MSKPTLCILYLLLISQVTLIQTEDFFEEFDDEFSDPPTEPTPSLVKNEEEVFDYGDEFINVPDADDEQWLPENIDIDAKAIEEQEMIQERQYYVEYMYVVIIVTYCLVFVLGRMANDNIKNNWEIPFMEVLRDEWSDVVQFQKERMNEYCLIATGRDNCVGMQAVLQLQARQDLVSIVMGLFQKVDDKLTIDIALKKSQEFILAIVPSKSAVDYKKEMGDLEHYTAAKKSKDISDKWIVLAENGALVQTVLSSKIIGALNSYDDYIETIHITDHNTLDPKYNRAIRIVMKLPDVDDIPGIMNFIFTLTDAVTKAKLTQQIKTKITQNRTKIEATLRKQQATETQEEKQKRLEEKRAKKEAHLSEKQQEALERKREAKRLRKRQQVKFKVV